MGLWEQLVKQIRRLYTIKPTLLLDMGLSMLTHVSMCVCLREGERATNHSNKLGLHARKTGLLNPFIPFTTLLSKMWLH